MDNRSGLNNCSITDFGSRKNGYSATNPNKITNFNIFINVILGRIWYMLAMVIIMVLCNDK